MFCLTLFLFNSLNKGIQFFCSFVVVNEQASKPAARVFILTYDRRLCKPVIVTVGDPFLKKHAAKSAFAT